MTTKKDKMISRANTDERSVFMLSFLNLLLVILNLLVRFLVLFSAQVTKTTARVGLIYAQTIQRAFAGECHRRPD